MTSQNGAPAPVTRRASTRTSGASGPGSAASHGLAGMRHRVEATGGRLVIDSAPGQGTRVSATLPVVAA